MLQYNWFFRNVWGLKKLLQVYKGKKIDYSVRVVKNQIQKSRYMIEVK